MSDLVADVLTSDERLEATWAATTDRGWQGRARPLRGEVSTAILPFRRWIEVEVHHVDLGVGYLFADIPTEFVRLELSNLTRTWASRQPMGMTDLPASALALLPHERLAWLMGRLDVEGLAPAGVYG